MFYIGSEKFESIADLTSKWEFTNGIFVSNTGNKIKLGYGCLIGKGCEIGKDSKLGDECKLGYKCKLGNNCLICYGTVLGNGCEIGYGCVIGKGCKIGNGSKLIDGCQLGYYCQIGPGYNLPIQPIWFSGPRFAIGYYGPGLIASGCIIKPVDWWLKNVRRCAEEHEYSSLETEEYAWRVKIIAEWMDRYKVLETELRQNKNRKRNLELRKQNETV